MSMDVLAHLDRIMEAHHHACGWVVFRGRHAITQFGLVHGSLKKKAYPKKDASINGALTNTK
jgi:hypothetical protein